MTDNTVLATCHILQTCHRCIGHRRYDQQRCTCRTFSERARAWVAEHVLQGLMRRLAVVTEGVRKHRLGLQPLLPEDRDWHSLRPDASTVTGHLQYCASALDGIKRQLQQAQQAAAGGFQQQQQTQQLAQLREQHKAARQHLQVRHTVLQGSVGTVFGCTCTRQPSTCMYGSCHEAMMLLQLG